MLGSIAARHCRWKPQPSCAMRSADARRSSLRGGSRRWTQRRCAKAVQPVTGHELEPDRAYSVSHCCAINWRRAPARRRLHSSECVRRERSTWPTRYASAAPSRRSPPRSSTRSSPSRMIERESHQRGIRRVVLRGRLRLHDRPPAAPTHSHVPACTSALGNVLGATTAVGAVRLLRVVRTTMNPGDSLILGLDARRHETAQSPAVAADVTEFDDRRRPRSSARSSWSMRRSARASTRAASIFARHSTPRTSRLETHLVARRALRGRGFPVSATFASRRGSRFGRRSAARSTERVCRPCSPGLA